MTDREEQWQPAKFVGERGEFYSGVTPGAEGEASMHMVGEHEFWAFRLPGGASLSVPRSDLQMPEDEHQADEPGPEDEQRRVVCQLPDRGAPDVHFHDPDRQEREDRCTCPDPEASAPAWVYTRLPGHQLRRTGDEGLRHLRAALSDRLGAEWQPER